MGIDCEVCGLRTWVGCGLHIERALQGVSLEDRCSGWETGKCNGVKETVPTSVPPSCEMIERYLRKAFDDDIHFVEVKDTSGGGGSKFSVVIALSRRFDGVKLLDRHRMITGESGALGNIMDQIHALELKTWTKAQYDSKIA